MTGHPRLDQLTDLVLGHGAEAEGGELRGHLESCGECARQARRIEAEKSLIFEALSGPPPAGLAWRILDTVERRPARRRAWMARIPVAAAAAIFLAVLATLLFRTHSGTATEYVLGDGTRVTLAPQAGALLPGGSIVDLRRGRATFRMPPESSSLKVITPIGTIAAHGAEFTVELWSRAKTKGESQMETLLALVVAVMAGNVRVDAAGSSTALTAGESQVFTADAAIQDKDDGEKGEKGKKKDKDDDGDKEDGKKKEKKEKKGEKDDEGKEKGKKKDKKEKEDD